MGGDPKDRFVLTCRKCTGMKKGENERKNVFVEQIGGENGGENVI